MSGKVRAEKEGHIGWILFDHPERHNAITGEMWREIPRVAQDFAGDPELRVVVMRGVGEAAFVSGADISEFSESRRGPGAQEYDRRNAEAFAALSSLPVPLVAQIHGYCVGGGCAIALCADLRYCADDGVFGIPAARLGLGYAADGLENLVRVVGEPTAKELFFTARRFGAEEALRMGLVNDVLPKAELDGHVRELAEGIASNAPLTLRSAKLILAELARDRGRRNQGVMEASIRRCYESADYGEGVSAFLKKRRPRFQGR
jgi:enoyl-CoA hydratase/carnithine racemase